MIVMQGQTPLLQVVLALSSASRFSGLLHRWQEQCDQNCDDGDHHQQFNQSESAGTFDHEMDSEDEDRKKDTKSNR